MEGIHAGLDTLCLDVVFRLSRYLNGKQCAMLSCCSRTFRDASDNEKLWKVYLYTEFGKELSDQEETKYKKFKNGYRKHYRDLYVARRDANRSWDKIKNSTTLESRRLNQGVDEETISVVEECLGLSLPMMVKEVYRQHCFIRIHNGQCAERQQLGSLRDSPIRGLVSMNYRTDRILPLEDAFLESIDLRDHFLNEEWFRYKYGPCRMQMKNGIYDPETIGHIVCSSIVVAEKYRAEERKLLLIKPNTNEVFLWTFPSSLVQVATKSSNCNPMLFLNFFSRFGYSSDCIT
eukprot:g7220.t1